MFHIIAHRLPNKRNHFAKKQHRRALSVLESIGCIAAIGTGIWLGATYLGLDLKSAWNYGADKVGASSLRMEVAEIEEGSGDASVVQEKNEGVLDDSKEANTSVQVQVDTASLSPEEKKLLALKSQLASLQEAVNTLENQPEAEASDEQLDGNEKETEISTTIKAPTKAMKSEATLSYWNGLQELLQDEHKQRTTPSDESATASLQGYITYQSKVAKKTRQAIRSLKRDLVHQQVADLGNDFAAWFDKQVEINTDAAFLLGVASANARKGPLGKTWETKERHHRMELDLLKKRATALQQQMGEWYGQDFPNIVR